MSGGRSAPASVPAEPRGAASLAALPAAFAPIIARATALTIPALDRMLAARGDGADARLARWRHLAAGSDPARFARRLAWVGPAFAAPGSIPTAATPSADAAPAWATTLVALCDEARRSASAATAVEPVVVGEPFAELLSPLLRTARRALAVANAAAAPRVVLDDAARDSLERALAQSLLDAGGATLLAALRERCSVLRHLGAGPSAAVDRGYRDFVQRQLEGGLLPLFGSHPVLARLFAQLIDQWVAAGTRLLAHVEADAEMLMQHFGGPGEASRRIVALWTQLSDPHQGGETVSVLEFDNALQVVYKPRPVDLEATLERLLAYCNARGDGPTLRAARTLARDGYGWMEYVTQAACDDAAALHRYYERAGRLLGLLHALGATDCHADNVVAAGEHPVLVDAETLLQAQARPLAAAVQPVPPGTAWFAASILETGFVPRWLVTPRRPTAFDPSALGGGEPGQRGRSPAWYAIGTDDMTCVSAPTVLPAARNRPAVAGTAAAEPSGIDVPAALAAGFRAMCRLLHAERDTLFAPGGPLHGLPGVSSRHVLRETRFYHRLRQQLVAPAALRDGAQFAIELDALSRAYTTVDEPPPAWPALAEESAALAVLDIPRFTAGVDSLDLECAGHVVVPRYFAHSALATARARLAGLDEAAIARQERVLEGAWQAHVLRLAEDAPLAATAASGARHAQPSSPDAGLTLADAIAAQLARHAVRLPDGGATWLALEPLPDGRRVQLEALGWTLYHGSAGVALFFAAHHAVRGAPASRQLALDALAPLRATLVTAGAEEARQIARLLGPGAAAGLGSVAYALATVADLLALPDLRADAWRMAKWLHLHDARSVVVDDVVGGCAGAVLALLALVRRGAPQALLATAIAYGERLLALRETCHRDTDGRAPLTGMSHGAAGVACALGGLHAHTGDARFLVAAARELDYEARQFVPAQGNWPDHRESARPGHGTVACGRSWCHGAPGIALARLGLRDTALAVRVQGDLEAALATTVALPTLPTDGLCCGELGLADILLLAGQVLERPVFLAASRARVAAGVARRARGPFRLFRGLSTDAWSPGFFQGIAGIGYALLRQVEPTRLPCVLLWQ